MAYDFIAVGDITTDAFIKLNDVVITEDDKGTRLLAVRFGDKVPYESMTEIRAVGNSANAAVSAHRLGLKTALVTDVGDDDTGENILMTLALEGLSREYISVHPGARSNYHYVLQHEAERTILVKQEEFPYRLPEFSEVPRWMYLSSLSEHALEYTRSLATYVAESGAKLTFQPGTFQINVGVEALYPVYRATELFVCNKEEAQKILASTSDNTLELMKSLHNLGPKIVMVTDGPSGAYAYSNRGAWFMPIYPDPAPPVSRTGAGDAFASTVSAYLAEGMEVEDALLRGPINSMNVVQHVGAQGGLLSRTELEELLKNAPKDYKVSKL